MGSLIYNISYIIRLSSILFIIYLYLNIYYFLYIFFNFIFHYFIIYFIIKKRRIDLTLNSERIHLQRERFRLRLRRKPKRESRKKKRRTLKYIMQSKTRRHTTNIFYVS